MIKHTQARNVAELFSNEKVILYEIPKYQRKYTWGKKQLEDLFNDVVESDEGYFLGSIIGVDISSSIIGISKMEVIDGQQRLTSLSILLIALYNRLSKLKTLFNDEQFTDLINVKREIIAKDINVPRVMPQVENYNRDDYFSLLGKNGLIESYDKVSNARKSQNI